MIKLQIIILYCKLININKQFIFPNCSKLLILRTQLSLIENVNRKNVSKYIPTIVLIITKFQLKPI